MKQTMCFGIGCVHFGLTVELPYEFTPGRYVELLEQCLSELDTVTDIAVTQSSIASHRERTLTTQPPSMSDGHLFPVGALEGIEFSLRIPRRTQNEIMAAIYGRQYQWKGLGTDHFRIKTKYFYDGPVTLVQCLDVDNQAARSPSRAVVVIREYLEEKLKEHHSGLRLETVGPSPFHANFFVYEQEDVLDGSRIDHETRPGYDVVNMYLHPDLVNDPTEWVFGVLGAHLSFYYSLKRANVRRMRSWARIERTLRDVHESTPGRRALWSKRMFGRHRRILKLVSEVMAFRTKMIFERRSLASGRSNLQEKFDRVEFLEEHIAQTFEDTFFEYPTSEVLELAEFHEQRDAKWRDRLYLAFAALLGGTVGAAITQWLNRNP